MKNEVQASYSNETTNEEEMKVDWKMKESKTFEVDSNILQEEVKID